MADMTFDGQFSDLKMKVMSEAACGAIHAELVKLQDFGRSFSELEERPGCAIVIPQFGNLSAANDFDADSNNYAAGV